MCGMLFIIAKCHNIVIRVMYAIHISIPQLLPLPALRTFGNEVALFWFSHSFDCPLVTNYF